MNEPNTSDESMNSSSASSGTKRWQKKLLPLMMWMVIGLTLFFFVASFAQLFYLHVNIQQAPQVKLDLAVPEKTLSIDQAREFNILAQLEASTLRHRYHQANVFLMSRVWARYLGFVTGMILALVGAAFILGKLREEATEISAEGTAGSLNIQSSSPGIVLAVLGVVLMVTTVVTHHSITTADSPVYMRLMYEDKPSLGSESISFPDTTQATPKGPDTDFP